MKVLKNLFAALLVTTLLLACQPTVATNVEPPATSVPAGDSAPITDGQEVHDVLVEMPVGQNLAWHKVTKETQEFSVGEWDVEIAMSASGETIKADFRRASDGSDYTHLWVEHTPASLDGHWSVSYNDSYNFAGHPNYLARLGIAPSFVYLRLANGEWEVGIPTK